MNNTSKQQEFLELLRDPLTVFVEKQIAEFERVMPAKVSSSLDDPIAYDINVREIDSYVHKITITLAHQDLFDIVDTTLTKLFPRSKAYTVCNVAGGPHNIYTAPDGDSAYIQIYYITKAW